ncbi:40S ribosomal protein S5 [Gossypium hirsutum]|uniref:40S ribosomal protein S5 n=1 Tax=Gossypium hirsutum TaxID=3635 RepID=A0ABM2YVK8_GOSHI|nr:40S ribosomal protein S5-like [Gossypium hirsutum]
MALFPNAMWVLEETFEQEYRNQWEEGDDNIHVKLERDWAGLGRWAMEIRLKKVDPAISNTSSSMFLFELSSPLNVQLIHSLDSTKLLVTLVLEVDDFRGNFIFLLTAGLVEAKVPCNLSVECFTCGVVYNLSYVLHTAGRYLVKRFRKAQCPIVERFTNSLMMHGRNNGKKLMAVRIVKHAMEIIYLLTDQNPIQVIVDAIINSGPREDATRIGSAGVVRRQAVDISPLRRVNQAIYLLTTGNRESAFRNIKTIAECLADELINAAKGSSNSYAIKKKDEIERVAKANR